MTSSELLRSRAPLLSGAVGVVVWLLAETARFSSVAIVKVQVVAILCVVVAAVYNFQSKAGFAGKSWVPLLATQIGLALAPAPKQVPRKDLERRQLRWPAPQDPPAGGRPSHAFVTELNKAIASYGKAGDIDNAESMFFRATASGMPQSVVTYNSMIRACMDACADRILAEKYMNKLLASDVEPDAMSFNTMIDACVKTLHGRRCIEQATMWFDHMARLGVAPTEVTFGTIIHAHAKARDLRGAVDWLVMMEEAPGVEANLHAYSSVLSACARGRVPERRAVADSVFARMRAQGVKPNIVVYTAMVRGAARDGDYLVAEKMLEELSAEGLQVNGFFLDSVLWSYVDARPRQSKRAGAAFAKYAPEMFRTEPPGKHVWAPLLRCFGEEAASKMWAEALLAARK